MIRSGRTTAFECPATAASRELACGLEDEADTPGWFSLGSEMAGYLDEHRGSFSLPPVASSERGGVWTLSGAAPIWFSGAAKLHEGRTLSPSEAFSLTELLSAGDGEDLERLLKRVPHDAVRDEELDGRTVRPDADMHWARARGGLVGVACEMVGPERACYRLVERPSLDHPPRYVPNALSLCQRRPADAAPVTPTEAPASPPKRPPATPLSPAAKRAKSLAKSDSFHDIDAAQTLAGLLAA